jgi:hypothetical protein
MGAANCKGCDCANFEKKNEMEIFGMNPGPLEDSTPNIVMELP